VIEVALLVALVLLTVSTRRLLRDAGPLAHWMTAWTLAGSAGVLSLIHTVLPQTQLVVHPLGTLCAALLFAGALVMADRPVPSWLLPAALAFGLLRALVASIWGAPAGFGLGLAVEPFATFSAAYVLRPVARNLGAAFAERWLAPSFVLIAFAGAGHLAWMATGGRAESLAPMWIFIAAPVIGIEIQAAGDRLRRISQAILEKRVSERTAALGESEERFREISRLASDFAFKVRIDSDGQLAREWVWGAFGRTLGFEPEALDGRGWQRVLEPATHAELPSIYERLRESETMYVEQRLRRADGSPCWVQLRLGSLRTDAAGTIHVLGAGRDVTELKCAEAERERLARHVEEAQRLESLGILAGGIAHDFNNLLTVIRGSARLALDDLSPDVPARERVARIAMAADQAAALTDEMLAYAGKSSTALAPVDLNALLGSTADLLRGSIADHAKLAFDLAPALPAVEVDAGAIRRVVMNLVMNAAESVEAGGGVTVRTRVEDVDAARLAAAFGAPALEPGRFVVIEVHDDGHGIEPATLSRVFEPFFSTKFSGRGLGLAAVLGIVQSHRGAIEIESAPGIGTTVRVLLAPSARSAAVATAPVREVEGPSSGAVLLVDDDDGVLELAREVLERAGYRVLATTSPHEALERLADAPDLVAALLDLVMPEMSGEELFLRLREIRPDLPVILVTGYDAARAAERFSARGLDGFLHKPWEPEEMVAAVQHAARPASQAH
jgi:PAS domain S-box-containing protein